MTALRLAHRGDWRVAPENTLAAFKAAMRIPGCDGVELDVRGSADGAAMVIHDETLQRVQGVNARVDGLAAAELAVHAVPALTDVLATLGRDAFIDVELKEWVPITIDLLDGARGTNVDRIAISSFHDDVLRNVRSAGPAWRCWLTSDVLDAHVITRASQLGCSGISAYWRSVNPGAARLVREANLELIAWTVRGRPTYARLERLGVDAICAELGALDD